MLICNVVGARPNFIKMAPVIKEMKRRKISQICVHTGQHYDPRMSDVFFNELGMPRPDIALGSGGATHAEQTARIMIGFEKVCMDNKVDLIVVAGDVNSTLACALTGAKLNIPIVHVEAGLRSFDRSMPEEINRVLTDHVSSFHFTTEASGNENLLKEGISKDSTYLVGNPMIDSLDSHLARALELAPWQQFCLEPGTYGLVTLHRPANVDDPVNFSQIGLALKEIAEEIPLLFPVHPRTLVRLRQFDLDWNPIKLVEPLGYLEFLGLMAKARLVLTDSGGIQEETTALGVPCVTVRNNTERPITINQGTNRLAGISRTGILNASRASLLEKRVETQRPYLWDGRAASRILDALEPWMSGQR